MRLEAEDIRVHFEGVKAVDGVDAHVEAGEILGLIGPNGAGKTTFVNVVSGFQRPTTGRVVLGGTEVTSTAPHRRVRLGLARTFQGGRLFPELTAFANVRLGALGRGESASEATERAWALMDRLGVAHRADELAESLPHGDERLVGIARALAGKPRFLLLDEPAAGLNDVESASLLEALSGIRRDFDVGIVLIEHDVKLVLGLCDRVHVLDEGKTLAVGSPAEIRADARVIAAYLGTQGVDAVA